jgi:hypothetical protein
MFMGSNYGSSLIDVNFQGWHNLRSDPGTKGLSGPVQQASGSPLKPGQSDKKHPVFAFFNKVLT